MTDWVDSLNGQEIAMIAAVASIALFVVVIVADRIIDRWRNERED